MSDKPAPAEQQAAALALLVKSIRENLPAHLELATLQSKITRRKYLALIEAGFTEVQALELCK